MDAHRAFSESLGKSPRSTPTLIRMGLLETALGEYQLARGRLDAAREAYKDKGLLTDLEYLNFWLNELILLSLVAIQEQEGRQPPPHESTRFEREAILTCTTAGKNDVQCVIKDVGFLKKILQRKRLNPGVRPRNDVDEFERACRDLLDKLGTRSPGKTSMIGLVEANTSEEEREGVPYSVVLSLTDTCNGGCPGCFAPSLEEPRLTVEALERIFGDLRRCGVRRVSFGGGEPTTRDDLEQIIEVAKKKGLLTALSTNGMTFGRDPGRLKRLEGRLDEVLVDYHSTRPQVAQVFSPYMDQGHLDRAERLFAEVLKWKIQLKVATVMFKGNADPTELETTGKRLQDIGVRIWKVDQYYYVADPRRPDYDGVAFSINDDLYVRNLEHLRTRFPGMKIIGIGAQFKREQKNFMISAGGTAFINNKHKTQPLGAFLDLMKQGTLLPTYWSSLPVRNYEILE
jgi:MoaA/NifB/PqqE/SkfB family radical SAM enzyme